MTCARCKFFTRQNLPAGAVDGEGLCLGYLESLQELVAWDRELCGIYRPARPMAPREDWIAARIAGKGEGGNAAGNDPEGPPRCAEGRPATESHPCRK
jgi:hypothetical protein